MKNGYKWLLLLLLSSAFFFHQADRALFGLLTIPIQDELKLSDVQIGWINTVLSWTLAGMAFVAGPVGDRFSRKWVITLSLIAWSFMTFMMGFVGDWRICGFLIPAFFVVMFFRSIATGVGESFYGPCYPPLIAAYHKATRSIALSIHQGALYVGLMTSGVLTAWALGVLGSWRHVFMVFGGAGFALGVGFIWLLKDTGRETKDGPAAARPSPWAGFVYFFKCPSAWCAMAGFIAIVFVNNAYLFWAPKFMAQKFGVSVGAAGTQTMLYHHLFAFVAIIAGGILTDRFVKRMPRFRLGFQILSMLAGAPCLVLVGFSSSVAAMVAMTGFIAIVFVNNAYLFWAPKFMAEKFGVSVGEAGAQTMFYHHLLAFIAILAGGVITDRFVKRWPRFRLGFQILALLAGAPCLVMTGFAPTAVGMVAMAALYGVFRGFFEVNTHASLFDVIAPAYRSTAVGIFTVFAFFFGGLSGVLMGALSQKYGVHGFEIGFSVMGATYVIAALLMMISFFVTFKKDRIAE